MSDDSERPPRPWLWPLIWLKDEKFWRDIATRTASGLLLVGIGAIFGVLSGIFKVPSANQAVHTILGIAVLTLAVFATLAFIIWVFDKGMTLVILKMEKDIFTIPATIVWAAALLWGAYLFVNFLTHLLGLH